MSQAPARFKFDLDLGGKSDRTSMGLPVSAVSDLVANARQEGRASGYAEGFAEGERSVTAQSAQRLATAAEHLADRTSGLLAALDDTRLALQQEAIGLAASIARKLASQLLATQPSAEIEALLAECMATLEAVPHLVIRCHPDLAEKVREIATSRATLAGFTGRLIVMGDPDQAMTDGRIEWADGGLVRDSQAISDQIDEKIAAYVAARGARRHQESEQ